MDCDGKGQKGKRQRQKAKAKAKAKAKGNCRSLDCDARHRFAMEEKARASPLGMTGLGYWAGDTGIETRVVLVGVACRMI